jgi:hypothetical protein
MRTPAKVAKEGSLVLTRVPIRLLLSLLIISVTVLVGSVATGIVWLPALLGALMAAAVLLYRVRRGLASSTGSGTRGSAIATFNRYQPPRWAVTAAETATGHITHGVMVSVSKPDDDSMRERRERCLALAAPAATGPARTGVAAAWMPLR